MRCAYCKQPCEDDAYGNNDYEKHDVNINGMDIIVYVHNECLPKILGQWINGKIHPVLYGTPYDCAVRVTCDAVKRAKEMDE